MGAPIESIILANNANHNLADLVSTGMRAESPVVATLAPAMDIQVPSNLERLQTDPTREFTAGWADDSAIVGTIREVHREHGYLLDPHTATAWHVGSGQRGSRPQLVVGTAHPAKFPEVIEEATGRAPTHPTLEALMSAPERHLTIDAEASALSPHLR
jgi:threonine synthase